MNIGLSRERIVAAALDVLDEQGIDGVTVRAVAARLNVKAPALYWHVRDKQELLDEMGTEIQRRVNSRAHLGRFAGRGWGEGLNAYARALRAEYLVHRDGARTFSGTRLTSPELMRDQEPWLESWTAAGLNLTDAVDAGELVTAFVVGFVIEEQERRQSAEARHALATRDAALGEGAPLVIAAGHARRGDEERFNSQLNIVLDGLEARFGS